MGELLDEVLQVNTLFRKDLFRIRSGVVSGLSAISDSLAGSISGESGEVFDLEDRVAVCEYGLLDDFLRVGDFLHNVYVIPEVYVDPITRFSDQEDYFFVLRVFFWDGYDGDEGQEYFVSRFDRLDKDRFLGMIDFGDGNVSEIVVRVVSRSGGSFLEQKD